MKRFLLSFILFFGFLSPVDLLSQEAVPEVIVKYESVRDGSYIFYSVNNSKYTVTIDLDFTEMENLAADKPIPFRGEAKPGRTNLFSVSYITKGVHVKFKYEFTYIAGCAYSAPDYSFVYLLPVKEGSKARFTDFSKICPTLPGDIADQDCAIYLRADKGDTVYAARSGYVFKVTDPVHGSGAGSADTIRLKSLEIYHSDGSFGYYQILDNILVKSGDRVFAGQPLATVLTEGIPFPPHFVFAVYHNTGRLMDRYGVHHESPQSPVRELLQNNLYYEQGLIPVRFITKEEEIIYLEPFNDYTSVHPEQLVIKELTRKEVKSRMQPKK
ncbi:MAG: hypothetical protein H6Q22_1548 [Bacteroidetes bacterium]|nr:hypothetical protein [Bacteroidota bacterium]